MPKKQEQKFLSLKVKPFKIFINNVIKNGKNSYQNNKERAVSVEEFVLME